MCQMDEKFYHPDKVWNEIDQTFSVKDIYLYADSDTIHSVLIKPHTDQPKATILYFHGNAANISKWINSVRMLIDDGFQVCMLDYRGFGKSTGKPTHINIAHDAQLLLDTILTMDELRGQKIIVYGASIGTQVATHITKNNNQRITALVLDGMMTSFTDVALATTSKEYHEYIKQLVTSPYSAQEDIQHLKDIRLLFIHSAEDFLPIDRAKETFDKVTNCPKVFWEYKGNHVEAPLLYPQIFTKYINDLLK